MITCRLKELAEAQGLNKSQVQKRTGLDMGLVRRYWDDDTESFKRDAIDRLCNLLDCDPGDLLRKVTTDSPHLGASKPAYTSLAVQPDAEL